MKRLFGAARDAHIGTELLSAYLDGQVTAAERDRVRAHLQQCALCQSEAESLRQTIVLMRALPRIPVPRAFTLSEAQVGIRRPGAQPVWLGGLVRGLGVVTAVALIALFTTTLLRQQTSWAPTAQVARVAPAAEAPAAEAPAVEPAAVTADMPAEEIAPAAAMAFEAVPAEDQPEVSAAAPPVTAEPALAMEALTQAEAAPEAAQMKDAAPEPGAEAADASDAAMTAPTLAMEESPAAPAARGLGGGGLGGAAFAAQAGQPSAALTPALAPAMISPATVLPEGAGFVFADGATVSALDAASGIRTLTAAVGASQPIISENRSRIAYRAMGEDGVEIQAVSWDGKNPATLVSEGDLAAETSAEGAGARRIQTVNWIPGQDKLALIAAVGDLASRQELWRVDVPSGERLRVLEMGPSGRVFYAPGGSRFAAVEYGTPEQPEGVLTLYAADGGAGRTVARFPAAPGAPAYPAQVRWLATGDELLFAAPPADPASGVALYRQSGDGDAQLIGSVPAVETAWSADGARLAYLQPVAGAPDARELVLAEPNGANPQPYAQLQGGGFLGWSPYGQEFLYLSDNNVYAGAPDRAPELLGNSISVYDPHWVAPGQLLALLDQGGGWMLVWRDLAGGDAGSLAPLPKDISYDYVSPNAP